MKYCSLSSVIKYCYSQRQKHLGCSKICQQIEWLILYHDADKNDTTLDLYNRVAKFDFKNCFKLQSRACDQLDIDENSIPTLLEHHKDLFIEEHWKRVLLFNSNCDGLNDVCPCLAPRVLNKEDFKHLSHQHQKKRSKLNSLNNYADGDFKLFGQR